MRNHWQVTMAFAISILLAVGTGCVEFEMEEYGEAELPFSVPNGLEPNGLPFNGLPFNGLPFNGLPTTTEDGQWDTWMHDDTDVSGTPRKALNFMLMKYITKCALGSGTTSSYEDSSSNLFEWHGEIGLAPGWASGGIQPVDQRWISSCVASLVNRAAVSVMVSQRGRAGSPMDTMVPGEEDDYIVVEGAYFGDMFADPPALYTCKGAGYNSALNTGRECSIASGNCPPVTHVGNCSDVCSTESRTVGVETFDVFYNCDPDGAGAAPTFAEVTTIYLNPAN